MPNLHYMPCNAFISYSPVLTNVQMTEVMLSTEKVTNLYLDTKDQYGLVLSHIDYMVWLACAIRCCVERKRSTFSHTGIVAFSVSQPIL